MCSVLSERCLLEGLGTHFACLFMFLVGPGIPWFAALPSPLSPSSSGVFYLTLG